MANIKSSKKDIKRITIRTARNKARMSEIKTLTKKFKMAVESGNSADASVLFKTVQAKVSRAKGKGLLKANSASRRVSAMSKAFSKPAA
jgi:small subunit ribosomal protein S20